MSGVEETKVDGNVPSNVEKVEEANEVSSAAAQEEVKKQKKPKPNNKKLRQGKVEQINYIYVEWSIAFNILLIYL